MSKKVLSALLNQSFVICGPTCVHYSKYVCEDWRFVLHSSAHQDEDGSTFGK